jgi:hypothetical protein
VIRFFSFLSATAVALGLLVGTASAQDATSSADENVFVMGGPFASDYFSDVVTPWDNSYESNFFVGVGYQRFIHEYSGFKFGFEAGVGLRAGYQSSVELWGGAVGRFGMFQFGDISITPSITAGLSMVTDTIGVETERAARINKSVPVLYYLAPEIAVSNAQHPEFEGFMRIQHRSGGFGTIAEIDGSNAVVLGLRYKL